MVKRTPPQGTRYFVCSHRYSAHDCESTGLLPADFVEACVGGRIQHKLVSFGVLRELPSEENPRLLSVRTQMSAVARQKQDLLRRILVANDATMKLINIQAAALEQQEAALQAEKRELEQSRSAAGPGEITDSAERWDALAFDDKRAVLDILVKKVAVSRQQICITWKV